MTIIPVIIRDHEKAGTDITHIWSGNEMNPSMGEPFESYIDREGVYLDRPVEAYFEKYNAVYLVQNMPETQKKAVRWYIDCGDDDFLYEGNSLIHIAMKKNKIPHEYRVRDGGHTWTYWRESLPEVLRFISDAFHQH